MGNLINKRVLKFAAGFLGIIFVALAGIVFVRQLEAAQTQGASLFGVGQAYHTQGFDTSLV